LSKKIIEMRREIVVKEKAIQIDGCYLLIVSDKNLLRMEMTDESRYILGIWSTTQGCNGS